MALTDESKVRINYTDNSAAAQYFDIQKPNRGYETIITLPIDFSKQADGTYTAYDSGPDGSLDVRQCRCDFFLTGSEQTELMELWSDTKGRARDITLELATGSGFFPFGADLGDGGAFTCSAELLTPGSAGMAPFRLFKNTVLFTLSGTPPAYSIPTDESLIGPITIGSVENIKFPDVWFQAGQEIGAKTTILNGGSAVYVNRGASADTYTTDFELRLRNARAARLLEYITGSGRTDAFSNMAFTVPTGSYPFGINHPSGGNFQAKIIQNSFSIKHIGYQQFNMNLSLAYVGYPS